MLHGAARGDKSVEKEKLPNANSRVTTPRHKYYSEFPSINYVKIPHSLPQGELGHQHLLNRHLFSSSHLGALVYLLIRTVLVSMGDVRLYGASHCDEHYAWLSPSFFPFVLQGKMASETFYAYFRGLCI